MKKVSTTVTYGVLILAAAVMCFPVLFSLALSFSDLNDILAGDYIPRFTQLHKLHQRLSNPALAPLHAQLRDCRRTLHGAGDRVRAAGSLCHCVYPLPGKESGVSPYDGHHDDPRGGAGYHQLPDHPVLEYAEHLSGLDSARAWPLPLASSCSGRTCCKSLWS